VGILCCAWQTRPALGVLTRWTDATITSSFLANRWSATSSVISSSKPDSTTETCTAPAYSRCAKSPKRCADTFVVDSGNQHSAGPDYTPNTISHYGPGV